MTLLNSSISIVDGPAPMPDPTSRDNLRSIITQITETQQRLAALEDARVRAREDRWALGSRLRDAQYELSRAQAEERSRIAYAYTNQQAVRDEITPVESAKLTLDRVQSEYDHIETVEASLDTEIPQVQSALRQLRNDQYTAISQIVCNSDEYEALLTAHTAAWRHLRSIKETLRTVQAGLHGQMPHALYDMASRSEPLEIRVGYPVDPELVTAWATSMSALENDADAPLPTSV